MVVELIGFTVNSRKYRKLFINYDFRWLMVADIMVAGVIFLQFPTTLLCSFWALYLCHKIALYIQYELAPPHVILSAIQIQHGLANTGTMLTHSTSFLL